MKSNRKAYWKFIFCTGSVAFFLALLPAQVSAGPHPHRSQETDSNPNSTDIGTRNLTPAGVMADPMGQVPQQIPFFGDESTWEESEEPKSDPLEEWDRVNEDGTKEKDEFDDEGRRVRTKQYDKDGNLKKETEYDPDTGGKTRETEYRPNGGKKETIYNEDEHPTSESTFDPPTGKPPYEEQGPLREQRITNYDEDGLPIGGEHTIYDDQERVRSQTTNNPDGSREEIRNDPDNGTYEQTTFGPDNRERTYNAHDRDGNPITSRQNYEDGYPQSETDYHPGGNSPSHTREWDENGNLTRDEYHPLPESMPSVLDRGEEGSSSGPPSGGEIIDYPEDLPPGSPSSPGSEFIDYGEE